MAGRWTGTPIETYFGRTLVVDVSSTPAGKPIPLDTVRKHLEQKKGSEILLLHTGGHSLRRGGNNSRYLFEWPYVDLDLAQYLSTKGLKAVGTDGLSIAGWGGGSVPGHGPITSTAREVHQTLLRMGTIIIEELTNLDKLLQGGKEFADVYTIFLPLRIDGSDGSPVRAVALKRRD
ncbi:cyclase family protein [Thermogymnomonas acidicola]|uniref:cyclase family protein n=1 Tax=Thermogymnomonas acidicola TaxID=399579 RepID=UPI0009464E26|nr:cyclase family protein [Thermogymnomonas acidicola]